MKSRSRKLEKVFLAFVFFLVFSFMFYQLGNDTVTTDDTHFKNWSYVFMKEFERGNYDKLYVTAQPGVLTIYSNILGFKSFHLLKDRLGLFSGLSTPQTDLYIHTFSKIPKVFLVTVLLIFSFYLVRKRFGRRISLIFLVLLGLDFFVVGHTRVIQTDILPAYLVFISTLLFYISFRFKGEDTLKISLLAGFLLGLATIEKASALVVLPVFVVLLLFNKLHDFYKHLLALAGAFFGTCFAFFPAFWGDFTFTLWRFTIGPYVQGLDAGNFTYGVSPHTRPWYYYIRFFYNRLNSSVHVGLAAFLVATFDKLKEDFRDTFSSVGKVLKKVLNPLFIVPLVLLIVHQLAEKKGGRYMLYAFPFLSLYAAIGFNHIFQSKRILQGFLMMIILARIVQALLLFPDFLLYKNPLSFDARYEVPMGGWGLGAKKLAGRLKELYGVGQQVYLEDYQSLYLFYPGEVRSFDGKTCEEDLNIVVQTVPFAGDSCFLRKLNLREVYKAPFGPRYYIYSGK